MLKNIAAFLSLILMGGAVCATAQDLKADETIKVTTELVSVPVIVTDRQGRYVSELKQADFAILQDGIVQPIEFFGSTEEPVTVAILIDTSHSTRPVLDDIKDAAKSFVKLLKPADQAMIVCFDRGTHVLSPLTHDQEKLRKAIKNAEIPDAVGTTLRDAVYETVFTSFAGLTGRKAIIVLTDGRDGGSHISVRNLLTRLEETDTMIYSVQFRPEEKLRIERVLRTGTIAHGGRRFPSENASKRRVRDEELNEKAKEFLQNIAFVTAGRFSTSGSAQLKKTMEMILDELRRQYRLGFYPAQEKAGEGVHEVKVRVSRPNLIVRARGSYRRQNASD